MLLPRRSHRDLHILPQCSEKLHKPLHRKRARAVAHKRRDMRLLDAQNLSSLGLLEPTSLNQPVNLQRQPRFQKLLPRMRKAEISKNVPATFFGTNSLGLRALGRSHTRVNSSFLDAACPREEEYDYASKHISPGVVLRQRSSTPKAGNSQRRAYATLPPSPMLTIRPQGEEPAAKVRTATNEGAPLLASVDGSRAHRTYPFHLFPDESAIR